MTNFNEVHLFAWIKENAAIIGAFLVVLWAMIVFWYKATTNKYLTRPEGEVVIKARIDALKIEIDEKNTQVDRSQARILEAIKGIEVQIHLEAIENSKAHQSILSSMIQKGKD